MNSFDISKQLYGLILFCVTFTKILGHWGSYYFVSIFTDENIWGEGGTRELNGNGKRNTVKMKK